MFVGKVVNGGAIEVQLVPIVETHIRIVKIRTYTRYFLCIALCYQWSAMDNASILVTLACRRVQTEMMVTIEITRV